MSGNYLPQVENIEHLDFDPRKAKKSILLMESFNARQMDKTFPMPMNQQKLKQNGLEKKNWNKNLIFIVL